MSARSAVREVAAKAVTLFGALFLVSVLLAAMPNHHAPEVRTPGPPESADSQSQDSQQGPQEGPQHRPPTHRRAAQKTR